MNDHFFSRSDEGDTSSSSSSENEFNILNIDEEGICCQSVPLVPPSSPVSSSKNRLNKRVKSTNSSFFSLDSFFFWFSFCCEKIKNYTLFISLIYRDIYLAATHKGKSNKSPSNFDVEKVSQISSSVSH